MSKKDEKIIISTQAIETAKKIAKQEPLVIKLDPSWLEQPDDFKEYKRNFHKGHRYMARNSVRPHAWLSEGWDG